MINVVTGGGSGIGEAVARALPKENTVIITGRSEKKLQAVVDRLNKEGHHIVAKACDVSNREDVRALAEYARSLGEIESVIHCAGISGTMGSVEQILRINALGTVYVNQEFYKVMDSGSIVDVSSNSGYILPSLFIPKKLYPLALENEDLFIKKVSKKAAIFHKPEIDVQFAYMISKNFTRWYSIGCSYKYCRTKGIRVVTVSPGYVDTPMTEKEKGEATDILLGYAGNGRGAKADELAFLLVSCADKRNGYLMGTDILCDAGCVNNGYNFKVAGKKDVHPSDGGNW